MSRKVVPMIHVPDVAATVDWYKGIGFTVLETFGREGEGLSFAIISFGDTEVMFNQGGRTSTQRRREVDLYVYADDVDELYETVKDHADVVEDLHDTFYGMREFIIRDLNRFWITFGQPSVFGMLLNGVREGKLEVVRAALDRGALKPHALSNALVAAQSVNQPDGQILALLQQAGATPPPEFENQILQAYVGRYRNEAGMEVEMRLEDGKLFALLAGQDRIRLIAMDKATFRPLTFEGVTVSFNLEADKAVGFVLHDGHTATQLSRLAEKN
jgi:uncharacterized glyoxalase superfamily protein PhnB